MTAFHLRVLRIHFRPRSILSLFDKIIKSSGRGRGNILYVGGTGEGNYSKIQDAIDNASDGDTVFVFNDSSPYDEPDILIDKSINLIGEDRDKTVIIDTEIIIEKSEVNVRRLTFDNSSIHTRDGFSDIVISNNYIKNGSGGIELYADNCVLISNSYYNNVVSIDLYSNRNLISNNIFINDLDEFGLEIFSQFGHNNVISNNMFINLKNNRRECIFLEFVWHNTIKGNEFNGYQYGIRGHLMGNNIISYNEFINSFFGIRVDAPLFSFSSLNRVTNNNFINNNLDVIFWRVTLTMNFFDSNYWDGWIGLRFPILSFLPYFKFEKQCFIVDWHPASEPYNITSTQGCGIE